MKCYCGKYEATTGGFDTQGKHNLAGCESNQKAAPREFDFLFNGENIKIIEYSAYRELEARLQIAVEALHLIEISQDMNTGARKIAVRAQAEIGSLKIGE